MVQPINVLQRVKELVVTPLLRTSPALDEVLRTCHLRAAFQSDPEYSGLRGLSTSAALGTVAHRLLEICARGEFDGSSSIGLPKAIEQKWDELMATETHILSELAVGQVATAHRWPGFALRKASAVRAASKIVESRHLASPERIGAATDEAIRTQAEAWLEGQQGRLVGRIDLMRRTKHGTEIVDYKSGVAYDAELSSDGAREVRASYVRQMLLYLSLVHEQEGTWPVKSTIESLMDGSVNVEVNPEKADEVASEAVGRLDSYNLAAMHGGIVGSPSPTNCRWCPYKAVCSDFLRGSDQSWDGVPTTIVGTLTTVTAGPPTIAEIRISGGNHPRGGVTLRRLPTRLLEALQGKEGSTISFDGLRRSNGSEGLSLNWYSQCWLWPTESAASLETCH